MGGGVVVLTEAIRLAYVDETGSTNSDLLQRVTAGETLLDGHWLIAARQSAGRGRLGRAWDSRTGNFHGSTSVAIRDGDPPTPSLALVAAIALHSAVLDVSRGQVVPNIKWPNDLLIGQAKLAGILLERQRDVVIVGVGCNLAFAPDVAGRATISLSDINGPVDVRQFAAALAESFAAELDGWRHGGLVATIARWIDRAHPRGTRLSISDGAQAGLTGGFDGLEQDGSLRLLLDDGQRVVINAGEVRLVGE